MTSLRVSLRDSLRDSLKASLGTSLRASLMDSLRASLEDSLRASLEDSLWASLRASLRAPPRVPLRASLEDLLRASLKDSLEDSLETSLGVSLGTSLEASLKALLGTSLRTSLETSLGASLRTSMKASLRVSLVDSLKDLFNKSELNYNGTYWWGQQDSYWVAYYLFCKEIGVKYTQKDSISLDLMADLCRSISWWYPRDGICFVCERPIICKLQNGVLHSTNGPAIAFKDGLTAWALNGVRVYKELVETPAEKLDPKILFTEKNAEVRREIVRKIGMERIVFKLGAKSLDKQGDYELLEFDLGDGRKRPYLKMKNPSIEVWHVEGVPRETKTVAEALRFRKPEAMKAIPVSDDGEEWSQQGDVCIWPENAKSLKPLPKILT